MRLIILSVAIAAAWTGSGAAHEYKIGFLQIIHPHIRENPKGSTVAAGYVTIKNHGESADKLIGASATIAQRVELHETSIADGVVKMRQIIDGLQIAPGQIVELRQGGHHFMLVGLTQPPKKGEWIKGTLLFEKQGPVEITYMVEPVGGSSIAPGSEDPRNHAH
jgi:copper(I)-binding protein